MSVRTRWIVLVLLLGIWVGIGVWNTTQSPEPQHVPLTYVSGQKAKHETVRGPAGAGMPAPDLKIQLDRLAANRQRTEKSFGSPKSIFAPVFPGQGAVSEVSGAVPTPVMPQRTPEELAQELGRQELAQFRYLGYLSRGGKQEAFLAKGKELHITRAGETIDQRVLVKTITPTGVMLQDTSSKVEQLVIAAADMPSASPPVGPMNPGTPSNFNIPPPPVPMGLPNQPPPPMPMAAPTPPPLPEMPGAPGPPVAPGIPPPTGR